MALPDKMTVIAIDRPGGPEVLRAESRPGPRPRRGEVLIKIAAAGLNGADLSQRQGRYPVPPGASDLLGLEAAGTIVALGADVGGEGVGGEGAAGWSVGDPVCVLLNGGGYAEYCTAPVGHCLPVPRGLSLVEAAALPEVVMTVWLNVFEIGRLRPGEVLLVHGGSSGIGTTAIQLAKALGAHVLATAGSAEKCRRCEALGAERAINYREEDFVAVASDVTRGAGIDVILDMVGGDYLQRNLAALAQQGRLVMIAFKAGIRLTVDFSPIQAKQLTITGSRLRPRSTPEKARLAAAVRKAVWPLIESGTIRPVIDSTVPLRDAARAHEHMQASLHIGKILLTAG